MKFANRLISLSNYSHAIKQWRHICCWIPSAAEAEVHVDADCSAKHDGEGEALRVGEEGQGLAGAKHQDQQGDEVQEASTQGYDLTYRLQRRTRLRPKMMETNLYSDA